jgi:hypothetical protein
VPDAVSCETASVISPAIASGHSAVTRIGLPAAAALASDSE